MRIIVGPDAEFELPAAALAAGASCLRLGQDVAVPEGAERWGFPDWSRWARTALERSAVQQWGVAEATVSPSLVGACVMELDAALVFGSGAATTVVFKNGRKASLIEALTGPEPGPAGAQPTAEADLPGADRDHRIPMLKPSRAWRLYLDETGSKFKGQAGTDDQRGRFMLVASPSATPIDSAIVSPHFHATEVGPEEVRAALVDVLKREVGILGVSSLCPPETADRNYDSGLYATMLLALRLLPIPTQGPVEVAILTEERVAPKPDGYWQGVRNALVRELEQGDPDRAKRMRVTVTDVRKGQFSGTAMADVLAYTWASPRPSTVELRKRWGRVETCLLQDPGSAEALRAAYTAFRPGRALRPEDWSQLLLLKDSQQIGAPVQQFLARLAVDASADPLIFQGYVDAASASVESKGYDLCLLQRQAAWLLEAAPSTWAAPPRIALLVATHALATGNHAGDAGAEAEDAVLDLLPSVWHEDIKLACLAALHVAVRRTNAYAFDEASEALEPLLDVPELALGPNLTGRLHSSIGQHRAFQGDPEGALAAFETALASFDRISDPDERRRESAQTMTYLALAMLDLEDSEAARAGVDALVGGLDSERIGELARSGDDDSRWHHHALVRFLAEHGTEADVEAYLSAQQDWQSGRYHPWPLILTYRAVLLHVRDAEAAWRLVREALGHLERARGTLAVIRAAIERVAGRLGLTVAAPVDLAALREELPAAVAHLDALECLDCSGPLLEPLRAGLPFNFR